MPIGFWQNFAKRQSNLIDCMKKGITIAALALLVLPFVVSAAAPDSLCKVFDLVQKIAGYLLVLLIILAVVFVIMAAFKYVTASGDAEKVKTANKQILYAVIAIVVGLLAAVVPKIVAGVIGTDLTACTSVQDNTINPINP